MKLQKKMLLGNLVPLLLVLALGVVTVVSVRSLLQSNQWVNHTHEVIAAAKLLQAAAVDMETGSRGYLLAGEEQFLAPYKGGQEVFQSTLTDLKDTVSDNPAQVKLLDEIDATIAQWRENAVEPAIAMRGEIGSAKTMDDMADLIGEAKGKVYFDKFRGQIATFIGREEALMKKRRASRSQSTAISTESAGQGRTAIEWVEHTAAVIDQAKKILEAAVNMETGMRGFLLAGKDEFLDPYNSGKTDFETQVASLAKTVGDNPEQVALLGEMGATVQEWQTNVTEPAIELRRLIGNAKTMNDMAALIRQAKGKVYFDKFREQIATVTGREAELMGQRQSDAASMAANTIRAAVAGTALTIFLALIVSFFLSRSIIKSILLMPDTLQEISGGDLTARLDASGKDEIALIARYVNLFVEKLQETIAEVATNTNTLASTSEELSSNAGAMTSSATQMSSQSTSAAAAVEQASTSITNMAEGTAQASGNTNSVASAAEEVSANLSTVGAAVEELSANMSTIASNTESATESVGAASAAIEEMSASLSEVSKSCADGSRMSAEADGNARSAGETMATLNEAAERVGKVVEAISGIAAQTNLLALNATIEAASAGEAGKGFAVVASEVKELAKQTAQATEEIGQLIGEMQGKTTDAVDATGAISNLIGQLNGTVQTIASAVEEQSATTNEISGNISRAAEGVRDVSTSVQEAALGATEISSNTQEATTGATEIASSVSGIASSIGEISRQATEASTGMNEVSGNIQDLSSASDTVKTGADQTGTGSGELAGMAARLRELVGQFKTE